MGSAPSCHGVNRTLQKNKQSHSACVCESDDSLLVSMILLHFKEQRKVLPLYFQLSTKKSGGAVFYKKENAEEHLHWTRLVRSHVEPPDFAVFELLVIIQSNRWSLTSLAELHFPYQMLLLT